MYDRLLYPRLELQQAQADTADLAFVYVDSYEKETCGVQKHGLGYTRVNTEKPLYWSPAVRATVDPVNGLSSRSSRKNGYQNCEKLDS